MNYLETLSAQGLIKSEVFQKLSLFIDLILLWNDRINLTGLKSRPQLEEVLVGEAVLALPYLTISSRDVLDFGSGAGIPGLVWAICDPTARIVSLESRQKKIAFQKEVVREACLKAEIICGRFPEAVHDRSFDVIASRAIRFSPMLWDDALKMLRPDGRLVRFVTPNAEVEPSWRAVSISDRARLLISEK
jgi:16S rRNA (guanine527-N7)-methyltransferase